MRLLSDYGDQEIIPTGWLREEVAKNRFRLNPEASLRIDTSAWKQWRIAVGMYEKDDRGYAIRDLSGDIVSTGKKFCTPRQAASLVLISLWRPLKRPLVKKIVGSNLRTEELNKVTIPKVFDEWVERTGAIEGEPVLRQIRAKEKIDQVTLGELAAWTEVLNPGQGVNVANLARQIDQRAIASYPLTPPERTRLIQWILNRATQKGRSRKKRSPSYRNSSQPSPLLMCGS